MRSLRRPLGLLAEGPLRSFASHAMTARPCTMLDGFEIETATFRMDAHGLTFFRLADFTTMISMADLSPASYGPTHNQCIGHRSIVAGHD